MKKDDFKECIKIGDHVLVVGQTKVVVEDRTKTKVMGRFKGLERIHDVCGDRYMMQVGPYMVPVEDIVGLDAYGDREYETVYGDIFECQT